MADGFCDWPNCQSQLVLPAIIRLHKDDEGRSPAIDEWIYQLCPAHTMMFAQWLEMHALHEEVAV